MTTPPPPAVSIVMAVFNGARHIDEAVQSVIEQTVGRWELVIVDDGSTDDTAQHVARFTDARIRALRQPNAGVSAARNRGIEAARAPLIALLDADDLWLPSKLEQQLRAFDVSPRVGLVYSGYTITGEDLEPRRTILPRRDAKDLTPSLLLEGNGIALSLTGVFRRSAALEVGGFDSALSTSADLDFALRVSDQYEVTAVRAPLALYRQHRRQMHRDLATFERDVTRIFDMRLPAGAPDAAALRRRAFANLYVRLALRAIVRGRLGFAARNVWRALRLSPSRLLLLPIAIARTRLRRA